jgi:hypothetical protein
MGGSLGSTAAFNAASTAACNAAFAAAAAAATSAAHIEPIQPRGCSWHCNPAHFAVHFEGAFIGPLGCSCLLYGSPSETVSFRYKLLCSYEAQLLCYFNFLRGRKNPPLLPEHVAEANKEAR